MKKKKRLNLLNRSDKLNAKYWLVMMITLSIKFIGKNNAKIISIKDLKIFKDAFTKTEMSLPTYNVVTLVESLSIFFQPSQNSCFKL